MIFVKSSLKFLQLVICALLAMSLSNSWAELGGKKTSTLVGSIYSKAPHKAASNSDFEVDKINSPVLPVLYLRCMFRIF